MVCKPLGGWVRHRFKGRYLWSREWGERGRCVWTATAVRWAGYAYIVTVGRSNDGSGLLDLAATGHEEGYATIQEARRVAEELVAEVVAMDTAVTQ